MQYIDNDTLSCSPKTATMAFAMALMRAGSDAVLFLELLSFRATAAMTMRLSPARKTATFSNNIYKRYSLIKSYGFEVFNSLFFYCIQSEIDEPLSSSSASLAANTFCLHKSLIKLYAREFRVTFVSTFSLSL